MCPITQELFVDPVICSGDGLTYERNAIEAWIAMRNGKGLPMTSPTTCLEVASMVLVPNQPMKVMVEEFKAAAAASTAVAAAATSTGATAHP